MIRKNRILCKVLLLAALLAGNLQVQADVAEVEQLLDEFNRSVSVKTANRFMQLIQQEGLYDDTVSFPDSAPADTMQQQVWYWAAEHFYDQQQYQLAVDYARKAMPLFHVDAERADCLSLISISYTRLGDYQQAAEFAKQCHEMDLKSGDADRISSSLNTLASIYLYANQPQEAEKYVMRGVEMGRETGNSARLAVLLGKAAEVYHAMGNDAEALRYVDEAHAIDRDAGREGKAAIRLAQKAAVLIGMKRYKDAEQVLAEIIPTFRKLDNRQSLGIACNKMGTTLLAQQREAEAVRFFTEAADIFHTLGDPYNEVQARRGLYETLWKSDPDEAKRQLDRFNSLKDSIYSNTSAESLARYNAEFGNDWLQLEAHKQRTAKWQAINIGVVIVLALLALAFCVWLVMRRRNRRQVAINQQLSAHLEELREQYRQLNTYYDNAMTTAKEREKQQEMCQADREFLEKAINTVNEQIYAGQVDAVGVAAELGMSLFQFRQRISAVTGETPQSFIQMLRMRRACHLLDNHPELNINEVALCCAYNDTPNFTRAFKKVFGMTPTQYQTRQKEPLSNEMTT